ncbi:amidase domain-containing protein [Acetobacterium wieringae]|uniref:amidase domain-containing protein n=1 Tax=Acetobacterium wieringae TaxID=52694 RepID=UPI0026EA7B23|nr:amidase domain-containing protein [Acetobacterium wieringae]
MKRRKNAIRRKRRRTMIGLALMTIMAVGVVCIGVMANSDVVATSASSIFDAKPENNTSKTGGNIKIRESDETIDSAMLKPINDYFQIYFRAMANLKTEDLSGIFAEPSSENAWINQSAMDYLIQLRQSQSNDLRISDYQIGLTVTSVDTELDEVEVVLLEDHTVNFAFIPDVASSSSGITHTFYLIETADGYVITEHYKEEDSFLMLEEAIEDSYDDPEVVADELLINALAVVEALAWEKDDFNTGAWESATVEADNDYDADAALDYAMTWVDAIEVERNDAYGIYDRYGGNCNNYISQCLFAGGIPMDSDGDNNTQWKWYGEEVDLDEVEWGRSPAWTGVEEFYTYASENDGYGLVACVDENVYSGSVGDVLQYGQDGDWLHSVIITDVITDSDGKLADYLINSNTTDRINYPASAYGYSDLRLIKILGWNDSE